MYIQKQDIWLSGGYKLSNFFDIYEAPLGQSDSREKAAAAPAACCSVVVVCSRLSCTAGT